MNISANDFIHPEDKKAFDNLQSIPLFPACVKAFMKVVTEQQFHGINMAQKIRLGEHQLPELYQHLPPICEKLDIEEPEFYLEMNPQPNGYTYGDTRTFITITSGLVEHLEEDELIAVIAHECGHIICRHVLYHTMADLLVKFGPAVFGPLASVSAPVRLALLYWSRRSELSADRAAAVIMGSADSVVETMIRLAGGPKNITDKVNVELYMQQAESYDKLQDSNWDKLLQGVAIMNESHPFLAVRAREISTWCEGEQYTRLKEAIENPKTTQHCSTCQQPLQAEWKFCGHCGATKQSESRGERNGG